MCTGSQPTSPAELLHLTKSPVALSLSVKSYFWIDIIHVTCVACICCILSVLMHRTRISKWGPCNLCDMKEKRETYCSKLYKPMRGLTRHK